MNRVVNRVAMLAALLLAVGACAAPAKPAWTFAPATSQAPVAAASGAPGAQPSGNGGVLGTIAIEAFDLGFEPAAVTVDKPGTYTVAFANTGAAPHDVTFADGTKIEAQGGQSAEGTVTIPEG